LLYSLSFAGPWTGPDGGGGGSGDLLADGTIPLTADWDAGAFEIRAETFESDVATGTAPFTIASTTVSTNLNADLLDGESATAFQDASAVLDTYAGIDPSANVQTLLGAATFAAFMISLDGSDRTLTGAFDATSATVSLGPLTLTAGSASTTEGALRWITSPAGLADNVLGIGNGAATEYFLQYLTLPTADGQFLVYDETSDLFVPKAMSGGATMTELGVVTIPSRFLSLAVADLSDTATPSVLTTAETTNKAISNYKASGADHVFTLPAAHVDGNIIFVIGDEFQIDIEPDTGANFFLNGTAMAANEHIQNTADTLGEQIVGYVANINGTLTWMFESKYTNFVEETP